MKSLFPCCSILHVFRALLFLFSIMSVTLSSKSMVLGDGDGGGGSSDHSVVTRYCLDSERQALLDFKSGLVVEPDQLSDWNSNENNTNCCEWSRVQCSNQTGHVTELHLDADLFNPRRGKIGPSLLQLRHLKYLDLSFNDFGNAPVPNFIGSFSELEYLDLSLSNFGGNIPSQLGNLSHLKYLDLSDSNFDGTIPSQLGNLSNLHYLDISYNYFDTKAENLEWLSHLSLLEHLGMDDTDLSKVTRWAGILMNLPFLTYLSLVNCKLGTFLFPTYHSSTITTNSSITTLHLSNNYLNPSIYHWLFNLTTTLVDLSLSHNQLTGPIPEAFGNMTSLLYLDLSSNQLTGTFPKSLATEVYYLNISFNHIQGTLPDLSSKNVIVATLDLSCNHFEGPIQSLPSRLSTLSLHQNNFSGDLSFLCHFSDSYLKSLDLSQNVFTGKLPDCIKNFYDLLSLDLAHNKLHGKIPTSIGSLNILGVLNLYNNSFDGELPLELSNCTSLTYLNVGANKLSGNIAPWIGEKLTRLHILGLRSNNFSGIIPLELCRLSNLHVLDLSVNHLTGTIPLCFNNFTSMVQKGYPLFEGITYVSRPSYVSFGTSFSLPGYINYATIEWQGREQEFNKNLRFLTIIDLSSNNLTGVIPNEVVLLHELVALNLSRNLLHGAIPQKIGDLKSLLALDLSRNHLSGGIPTGLSEISSLSWLDLSYNNLSGRIPTGTQLQSFNASQFIGNVGLCGPPLTRSCSNDKSPRKGLCGPPLTRSCSGDKSPLSSNADDTDEFWRWFYIGGFTGFAIGFWAIFGVLLLNPRARQCFFVFLGNLNDRIYVTIKLFIAKLLK